MSRGTAGGAWRCRLLDIDRALAMAAADDLTLTEV
jgi:hypothetical protein